MSLHTVAKHMAAQGRGPDDHLIHMSGKEVAGLQALAQAHGGSLTVNPQTGLPEAGFLDSIMPTVIGAGIGMATGNPWLAAGIMGGGTALNTGDLGKGLMAGLGAYGGASMIGGLGVEGALSGISPDEAKAATLLNDGTQEAAAANATDAFQSNVGKGLDSFMNSPSASALGGWGNLGLAAAPAIMGMMSPQKAQAPQGTQQQMIRPYTFDYNKQAPQPTVGATYQPGQDTSERLWFQPTYTSQTPYKAAEGGLMSLAAGGGPIEQMSNANSVGENTGYPQADINQGAYATPWQTPISRNIVSGGGDTGVNQETGEQSFAAGGGISSLGGYSDGGHMLKGPGDGMSDSIPAQIGDKQPARLADGEFVVPADVVSHLGNGSSDAGAKQLYKMMDRIRQQRTGKKRQAPQVNPAKAMPA